MSIISLIASISGIISIPLAIYFYVKPRTINKKILYSYRSVGLLPSPPNFADLQITYKGQEIKSLYMTRVALWNAGDDVIKAKDDIYPEDRLRIVFENPDLSIESKLLYVSDRRERIRVSFYPENNELLPEGILIDFDFLDPKQGLVIQVMHQNPQQEFVVKGKMTNSHRNKIGELKMEDEDIKGVISYIIALRMPFIFLSGMIFLLIFGSLLMPLLGYLSSLIGLISSEDFALIMNGSDSGFGPKRDFLIIVSFFISLAFSIALMSRISVFIGRKTQDILKASLNVDSELLKTFQDSTWSLNGQDISR